jgi:hypothetical protein
VDARRRLKLFVGGVLLGVSMFLIGGIGVVPAHSTQEPTTALQPWLLKTMCDYPSVDCTSRGPVVSSASTRHGPT